jgi:hypothetical protein
MRKALGLVPVIALGCAGCAQPYPPEPVYSQVISMPAANDANCREYSAQATVAGRQQQIAGRACRQSDGTWRIAEGVPGQPVQLVTAYAPPVYADWYPYYPWLWEPPIGLSLGASVVFLDRSRRFHAFRFSDRRFAFHSNAFRDGSRFTGFHDGFGGMRGGFGHFGMGGRHG